MSGKKAGRQYDVTQHVFGNPSYMQRRWEGQT